MDWNQDRMQIFCIMVMNHKGEWQKQAKPEYTETVKGDIPEEFGEAVRDNREDRETENEDLRSVAVGYELDPPTVFEGHQ